MSLFKKEEPEVAKPELEKLKPASKAYTEFCLTVDGKLPLKFNGELLGENLSGYYSNKNKYIYKHYYLYETTKKQYVLHIDTSEKKEIFVDCSIRRLVIQYVAWNGEMDEDMDEFLYIKLKYSKFLNDYEFKINNKTSKVKGVLLSSMSEGLYNVYIYSMLVYTTGLKYIFAQTLIKYGKVTQRVIVANDIPELFELANKTTKEFSGYEASEDLTKMFKDANMDIATKVE